MRAALPVFLIAVTVPLLAQEPDPQSPLAGHSHIGAAFDEGPRQAARLIEGTGAVDFPITAKTPRIQQLFNQGIGQLHGFWYLEAERSFRQIAAEDKDCAMAYFGMAMAVFYNQPRAAAFAREAYERRDHAGDRERLYIDAIARVFDVTEKKPVAPKKAFDEAMSRKAAREEPFKKRVARFITDLEEIVWKYPDDIEAKAFLVNQLWLNGGRSGITNTSKSATSALLDQIFAKNPMHPAHHYRIHLWDGKSTAERAVTSAATSGQTSPGIAHQWHMSGHIWAALERHDDAAWQQEASARVDHTQMIRDRLMPDEIHNYAHNNEWLIRSLRHVGRIHEALDLAKNMVELPRHPRLNLPSRQGTSSYWGPRRLFEVLEMFELWDEVLALEDTQYLKTGETAFDEARRDAWIGKAAYLTSHAHRGKERLLLLRDQLAAERYRRASTQDEAEASALGVETPAPVTDQEGGADDDKEPERSAIFELTQWVAQLEALDQFSRGEHDEALDALEKARFPEHLRVSLCLTAGKTKKALEIARAFAKGKKGQALPLATLCRALEARGLTTESEATFTELRELSAKFSLDVPTFDRLSSIAQRLGYGADWRISAKSPADVGTRPELDTLGPFRWSPSPIPAPWTLPDGDGKPVAFSRFEGRPVLVVFFLGFDCLHCVEQLKVLGPMAEAFREADIDIVAIGTSTVEQIHDAGENPYPFPILSDHELNVFKQWRVHDDFEKLPLHGTFLVDGAGLVRWRDISFEPFMDTKWLLTESKRLLALPVVTQKTGN